MNTPWTITILLLNSMGLLLYLTWLIRGSVHRILYTQDGVLYLLPCLVFAFVFVAVYQAHYREDLDDEDHPEE